jgi:hypothetical protein
MHVGMMCRDFTVFHLKMLIKLNLSHIKIIAAGKCVE